MSRTWIISIVAAAVALGLYGDRLAHALSLPYDKVLGPWLPVFGLAIIFAALVVRIRRANRTMIEGSAQLAAGRVYAALELYAKAQKLTPRNPGLRHSIALAQLYLWRVDVAIEQLETVVAQSRRGMVDTRALSSPVMAMALALANRRERAGSVLAEVANTPSGNSPYALLAQCILACRSGEWAQAETMVNRPEVYQFGGFFRAVSEVLNAWAVFNLRQEKLRFNRVALYSEAGPDALRKIWPELADFAERSA